jgi:hypothetical protein
MGVESFDVLSMILILVAHTIQTKDINAGNETASYRALPLGNNVYSMTSICFLICCPSHLLHLLAIYL